jgi:hypothetical protein
MKQIKHSYASLARYFVPLALQAASQALTHPLVAMVASRGEGGTANMAGLAQSNALMWFIGTLGAGLVTTGMVYAKSRDGYRKFVIVNSLFTAVTIALHALIAFTPLSHIVFGVLIGLPVSIETPAKLALLGCIPVNILFNLRTPYQVVLFNARQSGKAFFATVIRIVFTLAMSAAFASAGLIGVWWAVVCLTIPVGVEVILSRMLALPYMNKLDTVKSPTARIGEMISFTLPFSIGGLFLSLSSPLLGAFIARAAEPERMLPIFYIVSGIIGPMAFGVTRLQATVISFYDKTGSNRKLALFSITAGIICGLVPLILVLPGVIDWYYISMQKLSANDMKDVVNTSLMLVLWPATLALRAWGEGVASALKKPVAILTCQTVYLASISVWAFFSLNAGMPGNLIGATSITFANLLSAGVLFFSLSWEKRKPEEPVVTSEFGVGSR